MNARNNNTILATFSLSAAALFLSTGCANSNQSMAEPEVSSGAISAAEGDLDRPIADSATSIIVHGMSCPLCATNVDKQLLRVPGVESVSVDLSTGMIRVQVSKDQPPTSEALATAVRESGFTLVGQPTRQ